VQNGTLTVVFLVSTFKAIETIWPSDVNHMFPVFFFGIERSNKINAVNKSVIGQS